MKAGRVTGTVVALAWLLAPAAEAQVVELTAGDSTLYQASGGLATIYLPGMNLDLGGGLINGVPAVDAAVTRRWRGWDLSLGSTTFSSTVGGQGLSTSVIGVALSRGDASSRLTLFAGDVEPLLNAAFFRGSPLRLRGGGGIYYRRKVRQLTFSSLAAAAGKELTGLGDLAFTRENLDAGLTGGWLSGKPLVQSRSNYRTKIRDTLSLAASANFIHADGITLETFMASAGLPHLSLYGSKILGSRAGDAYGASAQVGPLDLGASFIAFKGSDSLQGSVSERLGRHLILREYATRSAGKWSESLGGTFQSNHLSINVSQQVFFTPYGNAPLQRSMTVTVHLITPWKSSTVNLASGVDPSGKIRYGVDGGMFLGSGLGGPGRTVSYQNTGKFRIEGTVVDEKGQPVTGAAIRLGKDLVFTDDAGTFFLRVKHERAVSLTVVPDEFTNPGRWMMVTAPDHAGPGEKVKIIVRRGMP